MLSSNSKNKVILLIIVIVILVLGALLAVTAPAKAPVSEPAVNTTGSISGEVVSPSQNEPVSKRTTLSGTFVCLPHKDKTGPQTAECAFGMKASDGYYYGIDFNMASQKIPTLNTGDKFRAAGLMTPIEALSSTAMQKYDIKGIFSVTDSFVKL